MVIINLFVNSYKWLVLGFEVFVNIVWSMFNCLVLVCIFVKCGLFICVELWMFDLSCNLYFVFVVMFVVGFDGIEW